MKPRQLKLPDGGTFALVQDDSGRLGLALPDPPGSTFPAWVVPLISGIVVGATITYAVYKWQQMRR